MSFVAGSAGEVFVRKWLIGQGFYVIDTRNIGPGAPMMEGMKKFVLPDMLANKDGISRWVEVKTRTKIAYCYSMKREHTGCERDHWLAYQEVERITGIPGWMAFLQLRDNLLLLSPFKIIGYDCQFWNGTNANKEGKPMVYFDVARFDRFRVEPNEIQKIKTMLDAPVISKEPPKRVAKKQEQKQGVFFGSWK